MKVVLESGYSSLDNSELFVRDGAFLTAGDEDVLMAWDNEEDFEENGNEVGLFLKKHMVPMDSPAESTTDDDNPQDFSLDDDDFSTDYDIVWKDNETVTLEPGSYIEFIVKARVVDIRGYESSTWYELELDSDDLSISEDIFEIKEGYPYKIVTRPLQHPAVGSLVYLNDWPEVYVLANDNTYYCTAAPYNLSKDSDEIKSITVI